MTNPFSLGNELHNTVAAKQKLEAKILNGTYVMDWRGGCDNGENCPHSGHVSISFQTPVPEHEDSTLSEDSYCIDCLLKKEQQAG